MSDVDKAYIQIKGDSSVGLHDVNLRLEDLGLDCSDKDDREFYRGLLRECFGQMYDGRAQVLFDDELPPEDPYVKEE